MKRTSILTMAVILVVGLIFTGCGESEATTPAATTPAATTPAATTAQPQYGGILKIISIRMPRIFGIPANAAGTSRRVGRGCLETLFVFDNDANPQPWLAESWESSPDQKSFTFHLRKGVKFHDGTDFNAKTVEWNLNLNREGVTQLKIIDSMDVIDEHTIRINFTGYTNLSDLADFFLRGLLMISPTAYETHGEEWCGTHPVGTGPFEFVSFERDVSLKYKKFDNYWQEGKPYLDGLEYHFIADATIAAISLERGEAHVLFNATPLIGDDLTKKGFGCFSMPSVMTYIAGDSANSDSPYSDQLVREAVEFAIDREAIVEGLGRGYQVALKQLCPPGSAFYNNDILGRPYNPTKAKELLAEAGYPSGFPTRIIQSTTGAGEDYAVAYQSYLKDVGIEAELEIVGDKFRDYVSGTWNNGLLEMNYGLEADIAKTYETALVTRIPPTLRPPEYEELTQKVRTSDYATRIQLAKDLQRAIYDFAMLVPLFAQKEMYMVVPSVHDHDFCNLSNFEEWSPENTWLSE